MRIVKDGGHRLFEEDEETSRYVARMLRELRARGIDAVREYSRTFDEWDPPDFELSPREIDEAIGRCGDQVVADTAFCQGNVRAFAEAQLATLIPLETEIRPGGVLGHKHIPVSCVGSYVPGGRYPMFGSAQMSIIPAKVAGVDTVIGCTPPVKGEGCFPATINAMKQAGADRIFVLGGVQALALMAYGMGVVDPADMLCGAGNRFVAEAKRQLFGHCGLALLAGPTGREITAPHPVQAGLDHESHPLVAHRFGVVGVALGRLGCERDLLLAALLVFLMFWLCSWRRGKAQSGGHGYNAEALDHLPCQAFQQVTRQLDRPCIRVHAGVDGLAGLRCEADLGGAVYIFSK